MQNANDLLMGGGVTAAVFPDEQYGTTVGGRIVRDPQVRQQTDFDTGKPKYYDDGQPAMQIVVHVQTDLRDPQDTADDGIRAFYLKGQMQQAVRDAVRVAGAKGLFVDGELHITYVRNEPNSRGRGNDKKIYEARYVPPLGQANNALMGGQAAATPAPSGVTGGHMPPAYIPPPTAPAPQGPPAGIDAAVWAAMAPEQRATVLAAMGAPR